MNRQFVIFSLMFALIGLVLTFKNNRAREMEMLAEKAHMEALLQAELAEKRLKEIQMQAELSVEEVQAWEEGAVDSRLDIPELMLHRKVHIYVYENEYRENNTTLSLRVDNNPSKTIELREGQAHYTASLPVKGNEGVHLYLTIGDKTSELSYPEGTEPVYVGMKLAALLPYGVELWTQEQILKDMNDQAVWMEGKLPYSVKKEDVELIVPFYLGRNKLTNIAEDLFSASNSEKVVIGTRKYYESDAEEVDRKIFVPGPIVTTPEGLKELPKGFQEEILYKTKQNMHFLNAELLDYKPTGDYKSNHFQFKVPMTGPMLAFLKARNQYFPIFIDNSFGYEMHHLNLDFVEQNGKLKITKEFRRHDIQRAIKCALEGRCNLDVYVENHIIRSTLEKLHESLYHYDQDEMMRQEKVEGMIGEVVEYNSRVGEIIFSQLHSQDIGETQAFWNKRHNMRGMNQYEFESFVRKLQNPSTQEDAILTLQTEILAFNQHEDGLHGDLESLMDMLYKLDDDKWAYTFSHIFDREVRKDEQQAHRRQHGWENFFINTTLLSFLVFGFFVLMQIFRPNAAINQYFPWAEGILQIGVWGNFFLGMLVNHYGGVAHTSYIDSWFLFLAAIMVFNINAYLLVPKLFTKGGYKRYLWYIGALAACVAVVVAFLHLIQIQTYVLMFEGFPKLLTIPHWHYGGGNHDGMIPFTIAMGIGSLFYGVGRRVLIHRLPGMARKNKALGAELGALKNQISPHFFFNSLNTVYSFSLSEESPKTSEAITKLSDLMRFVIYEGNQDRIDLDKELTYLEDYMDLQRLRLDPSKHELDFYVEGEPAGLKIAPLLLITFIENAFKHGISMNKESFIRIEIMIQEKGLSLLVENSNHGVQESVLAGEKIQGGIGLENTRQRLELLYPKKYVLNTQEDEFQYKSTLFLELS